MGNSVSVSASLSQPSPRRLKFSYEPITHELLAEVFPLLGAHHKEISHFKEIELNPDFEKYVALEKAGLVRAFTIRDEDKVVGYTAFFMKANLHFTQSLQASQDLLYLKPELRGAGIGEAFIRFYLEVLRKQGVEVVWSPVNAKHNFGPLLGRIGFELVDYVYAIRLEA